MFVTENYKIYFRLNQLIIFFIPLIKISFLCLRMTKIFYVGIALRLVVVSNPPPPYLTLYKIVDNQMIHSL